jgi:restriction system protein
MRNSQLNSKPVWVIRAGQMAAAHKLFTENGFIVLADAGLGDLQSLPKERQAFYAAYGSRHATEGRVAIRGIGGKFFRFVHEVHKGDLVLYPCILDKMVYFGVVTGSYLYDLSLDPDFPHRRKVRWEGSIPKKALSESARRELGAARTFFGFTKHIQEIQKAMANRRVARLIKM